MKVSIELIQDQHNSYPEGSIHFKIHAYSISITIDGYDREIEISKNEFIHLLKLLTQT